MNLYINSLEPMKCVARFFRVEFLNVREIFSWSLFEVRVDFHVPEGEEVVVRTLWIITIILYLNY